MSGVRVTAPAKINWTLEVLGKRPDGYHEIRSVMQTINSPLDSIELQSAESTSIRVLGATRGLRASPAFVRKAARAFAEDNLALRAAELLQERTGKSQGVSIVLRKHIPVAVGMGGGSSDAAATLLALRALWKVDISDAELAAFGAELGSDVPFFVRTSVGLVSGRGDIVERLPAPPPVDCTIAGPPLRLAVDKTKRMYDALRPEHWTDGETSGRLAQRIRDGAPVHDEDCFNAFETVLRDVDPAAADLFDRAAQIGFGRPHLSGSGPAFFFLTGELPIDGKKSRLGLLHALGEIGATHYVSGLVRPFDIVAAVAHQLDG